MSLSPYQQAILQEMGIPVWVPKAVYEAKLEETGARATDSSTNAHHSAMPAESKPITQEQKQSRLAQLRAQVGSESSKADDKSITKPAHAIQQENQPATSTPQAAPFSLPDSPEGLPLSAEQTKQCAKWLDDLRLACVQLGLPSELASKVMISKALAVDDQAIILPAEPLSLTPSQKRALWLALTTLAKTQS